MTTKTTIGHTMKKLLLACSVILIALSNTACSPKFISKDQTAFARKGMTAEQVKTGIPKAPLKEFSFSHKQRNYDALLYSIQTGQTQHMMYMAGVNGAPGYYIPQYIPVLDNYYFLFSKQSGLQFWGLFEDFTKSRDARISGAAEAMRTAAQNAEKP